MRLYEEMLLKDLPEEFQIYARENNITTIKEFTVNHLWNIFGRVGYQFYIGKLTHNSEFMARMIRNHYPNHRVCDIAREFDLGVISASKVYHLAHGTTPKKPMKKSEKEVYCNCDQITIPCEQKTGDQKQNRQ